MDFIDLAEGLSATTRLFLRQLTEEQDTPSDAGHAAVVTTVAAQQTAEFENYVESHVMDRPFLSKTAEAELYLLATNFLLYVAMVIIITMVAKIYFPEALERGNANVPTARSFSYRVVDADVYYGSDSDDSRNGRQDEDDDGDGEDDDNNDDDGSDDDDEVLDSCDEMEALEHAAEEGAGGIHQGRTSGAGGADEDLSPRARVSAKHPFPGGRPGVAYAKDVGFLEFNPESLSKAEVMKRLVFCCIMLNVTFVTWGALQERMLTRKYPRYTGEYFTYSYFLVFTNRFWTLIMSGLLLVKLKPRISQSTVIYEYSFPSISNMLSSWCQYEALRYVSFPATTLFKSFKLAPVMAMGKILGNKTYPQYDYIVALMIGIGITMFMASTDELKFGYDYLGEKASAKWTGVMLLFFFLFFDSFTSQFQSRMFQRHRDLSMVELMFATSAFSTVLSAITLVHTKELYPALTFVYQHSEIHLHFFLFSCCSTVGQLCIFYTIKNFGAVVFTLIMTFRILLSIALSCLMYDHKVSSTGFFGLMVVLGAVLYRIKRKAQGQQLLKWRGMDSDKALELVQEWHEHVDT